MGKLHTVCNEMDRYNIQILGISETNWKSNGSFKTKENKTVLFSGKEEGNYSHGVAMILTKKTANALIGYSPINDRILKVRIQAKPHNISIIQCYAPTNIASDEEMEIFYNSLQDTLDTIPNRDVKIIMGDLNAKVGKNNLKNDTCGKFGLGDINERGKDFIEFCSTNNLVIANTLFQHHPRHLYTWFSPDKRTRNQIDYIVLNQKWKSCIKNAKTRPGADCNSDHQLLTIDFKIRLKKMERPTPPLKLDYKTLDNNYRITVSNKFEILNQCEDDKTPNELWEEGKELLLSTA
ncbi:endonuclease/exonuclease/phosphatase family protein [Pseudomonas aeruginosa]|nr:endonuclease/exonuclease/phosphatase family protein [Pseudomonas aeruginosa]